MRFIDVFPDKNQKNRAERKHFSTAQHNRNDSSIEREFQHKQQNKTATRELNECCTSGWINHQVGRFESEAKKEHENNKTIGDLTKRASQC